jgi:Protein of unknown function (DUF3108)
MRRSNQPLSYHSTGGVATRAVLFSLLLGACGSSTGGIAKIPRNPAKPSDLQSLDDVTPHLIPGETMTWELTVAGLEAGRARFAAGIPSEADGTVTLQAQSEASGMVAVLKDVRDDAVSVVNVKTGVPVRTEAEAVWSGKSQRVVSVRVPGAATVAMDVTRHEKDGTEKTSKRTQKLPNAETHDALSAVLVMRAWDAEEGARAVLYSIGGTRMWRTELLVDGFETIDSELGMRRCVRIIGTAFRLGPTLAEDNRRPPRQFTMWRSDDEERIPLRIQADTEFGKVTIDLTSYATPNAD